MNTSVSNLGKGQYYHLKNPDTKASLQMHSDGNFEPTVRDQFSRGSGALSGINDPKLRSFVKSVALEEYDDDSGYYGATERDNRETHLEETTSEILGKNWDTDSSSSYRGLLEEAYFSFSDGKGNSQELAIFEDELTLSSTFAGDDGAATITQEISTPYQIRNGRLYTPGFTENASITT